jgi:hypothetical protein
MPKHFEFIYDSAHRRLTIFYNGRIYAGMTGLIAERYYKRIEADLKKIDSLFKPVEDGYKKQEKTI